MAIVKTITQVDFINDFLDFHPMIFSVEALEALFDYYDNFGEPVEYDRDGICNDWSEYKNIEEFQEHYGLGYKTIDDIKEDTEVIELSNNNFLAINFK